MQAQNNEFTTYEFSDQELLEAAKLTELQKAFIQHQIGLILSEKVNLRFDPSNSVEFMQTEAHITGMVQAYKDILRMSDEAAEAIREMMENAVRESQKRINNVSPGNIYDLNKA